MRTLLGLKRLLGFAAVVSACESGDPLADQTAVAGVCGSVVAQCVGLEADGPACGQQLKGCVSAALSATPSSPEALCDEVLTACVDADGSAETCDALSAACLEIASSSTEVPKPDETPTPNEATPPSGDDSPDEPAPAAVESPTDDPCYCIQQADAVFGACRFHGYDAQYCGLVRQAQFDSCLSLCDETVGTGADGSEPGVPGGDPGSLEEPAQTGTYRGYFCGEQQIIETEGISAADALANCQLTALNNPGRQVFCTFDGQVIYGSCTDPGVPIEVVGDSSDVEPPAFSDVVVPSSVAPGATFTITWRVVDPSGVDSAAFVSGPAGIADHLGSFVEGWEIERLPVSDTESVFMLTTRLAERAPGGTYEVWIHARDGLGNKTFAGSGVTFFVGCTEALVQCLASGAAADTCAATAAQCEGAPETAVDNPGPNDPPPAADGPPAESSEAPPLPPAAAGSDAAPDGTPSGAAAGGADAASAAASPCVGGYLACTAAAKDDSALECQLALAACSDKSAG